METPSPLFKIRGTRRSAAAGFTLPAILVVVGALLILAVGILLLAGIERNTARSFVDRQRADLAARAGLEDVKGILTKEAANDDFLVIQGAESATTVPQKDLASYLYIARGSTTGSFRYTPLFSTTTLPVANANLTAPGAAALVSSPTELATLSWCDPAKVSWVTVPRSDGKIVGRYAYWVEDLQGRVDAGTAGNTNDVGSGHKRYGWKTGDVLPLGRFPAPGLNPEDSSIGPDGDGRDTKPPLNQVALYALDPAATAKDNSPSAISIIKDRKLMISPDSVLAAAGLLPPLERGVDGHLKDLKARALEESATASVQPYDEQPLVPFAFGVDPSVAGKPKLNLNALLAKPAATAVDEMATWIGNGLTNFEARKGGFPDNYLKTLAANAIDYADADSEATVSTGITQGASAYRGLDVYPLMSEVILHTKYLGTAVVKSRKVLAWQMIVYVELWNHTSGLVNGSARVSYENGMRPPAIGAGVTGSRFDDPLLMEDPLQVSPKLDKIENRYWSPIVAVSLKPNQYKFYKFLTLNYTMDVGSSTQTLQSNFDIYEDLGSSGISLRWNDREVDRSDKLVRGNSTPAKPELDFTTNKAKQFGKANIPGHSYGPYNKVNDYKNNMGDSRQALYLRGAAYPLSDNSYPGNVSPNRRNIRNATIYENGKDQVSVYGRVLPSEWPDGGHDVAVNSVVTATAPDNYDPSNTSIYQDYTNSVEGESPTTISNRGRFYSATELGRVFDPVMYTPMYDNANDSSTLLTGKMPSKRVSWPSVESGDPKDIFYGGGNTLRIGRPEHPMFDQPVSHAPKNMPANHAARLLDLFHAGKSRSTNQTEREGPLVRIEGHVNINTATEDALRALVAGPMVADPKLSLRTSESHSSSTFAPPVSSLEVSTPMTQKEGDQIAKAIIKGRPFTSPSELASVLNTDNKVIFGNRDLLPAGNKVQWSDAAAEEAFARVYQSSTVRSRNFRIWVIGQSISATTATNSSPEILAEVRRSFTVFADPGVRKSDGTIDPTKFRLKTIHENDF